jgi:hypothetical protein
MVHVKCDRVITHRDELSCPLSSAISDSVVEKIDSGQS